MYFAKTIFMGSIFLSFIIIVTAVVLFQPKKIINIDKDEE